MELKTKSGHLFLQRRNRLARRSAFKNSSTIIGPLVNTRSLYRASCDLQVVRSYLIEKCRGHCRWKGSLPLIITVLCIRYRPYLVVLHRGHLTRSAQAESLRSSLHELEGLLRKYSPLMSTSIERTLEKIIKYGVVFSEVCSPIWKPARH